MKEWKKPTIGNLTLGETKEDLDPFARPENKCTNNASGKKCSRLTGYEGSKHDCRFYEINGEICLLATSGGGAGDFES